MRIPISYKISSAIALIVLLQISLLLIFSYNELISDITIETKKETHDTLSRLQNTLHYLAQKNDIEQIQVELSSLGSSIHIKHAFLVDENNKITASSRLANIGHEATNFFIENETPHIATIIKQISQNFQSSLWLDANKTNLYAAYPVIMGLKQNKSTIQNLTGIIFVHIDLSWIKFQVQNILQTKAISMFFMLGITAVIFSLFLNRFIGHRIENINIAARNFTDSGYSSRALVSGEDELSDLAITFNNMAKKVAAQNTELVKKEENISLILNSMEDGVITIDESGIIHSFNKAAEKVFGYSESEISGKNVNLLMTDQHQHFHNEYISNYVNSDQSKPSGMGRDLPALHKDGHVFSIHISVSEYPVVINNKRLFIGSFLDITAFKEQEQQLRQSQKMDALGKLTGGIAHDYNNMLGVILGYAELLKAQLSDNPKLLKYANEIQHAGERGAKLTRRLLAFSQKKSTELNAVDINVLIKHNKNMLEKTLTARIKLLLNLETDLWSVYIDQHDLEDAILNLCINAMHAMNNGGTLTLTTRNISLSLMHARELNLLSTTNEFVFLSICDTGTGINKEILNRIFDPFFSTKGDLGNGLGLSQVYGFLNRNKGGIKVESTLDKGSCFNLYFPRFMPVEINEKIDTNYPSIKGGNETILAVDDEPSLLKLAKEILEDKGYKVFTAESAQIALAILNNNHVDLLLSDIIMPEMDGYQLALKVREHYPSVKIQLASGYNENLNSQYHDIDLHSKILHKPINHQKLLYTIRALLDADK